MIKMYVHSLSVASITFANRGFCVLNTDLIAKISLPFPFHYQCSLTIRMWNRLYGKEPMAQVMLSTPLKALKRKIHIFVTGNFEKCPKAIFESDLQLGP